MKTKEINQWIHIMRKEEATKVLEAVVVAEGVMVVIQMTGTIEWISKTTENIENAVVAVAMAVLTSANSSHSSTVKNHKSLNLKIIAAAEVAREEEDVEEQMLRPEAEMTSTFSLEISSVMITKSLVAMTAIIVKSRTITKNHIKGIEMVQIACVEA